MKDTAVTNSDNSAVSESANVGEEILEIATLFVNDAAGPVTQENRSFRRRRMAEIAKKCRRFPLEFNGEEWNSHAAAKWRLIVAVECERRRAASVLKSNRI